MRQNPESDERRVKAGQAMSSLGKAAFLFIATSIVFASLSFGQMYKWTDEKGTVHFTDDPSVIPEKHQSDAESRKTPQAVTAPRKEVKPAPAANASPQDEGIEVHLLRQGEVVMTEVVLNGRKRLHLIVDTGASFVLIGRDIAADLGLTIDENTPFMPVATASSVILSPLVTVRSIRVGQAEVEGVDALVHDLPTGAAGLLGNSFLNKFRVVLDPHGGKMTLFPVRAQSSPDRPGGYGRDYWSGRFRFYNKTLSELRRMRTAYERQEKRAEISRIDTSIRFFENQLSELDRKASFAGVPRNWRE